LRVRLPWSRYCYLDLSDISGLYSTFTSSVYTSTYTQITKDFHCSRLIATLGLSMFVMGLGLGPMFLGPLSEFYGRRPIYIVAFGMFLIWIIPCAVAQNIPTMIVVRFFDGFAVRFSTVEFKSRHCLDGNFCKISALATVSRDSSLPRRYTEYAMLTRSNHREVHS